MTLPFLERWLDRIIRFFLVLLPFHVLLTVFMTHKIQIPLFSVYKELLLVLIVALIGLCYWKQKRWPIFDRFDWLVIAYIVSLLVISLVNRLSFGHVFWGGRYDFEFFFAFLLFKHAVPFLPHTIGTYFRTFIISATWALVVSILVRFIFHEQILLFFGFSADLSSWTFGGSVPIYQGIEGAGVHRFQGIFDGPNPAAFFIMTYVGILVAYIWKRPSYHFITGIWILILLGLVFLTYSRSAIIGLIGAFGILFLFNIRTIFQRYLRQTLGIVIVAFLVGGVFFLRYEEKIQSIVLRAGSTQGHFDRVMTGLKRFVSAPFGQGLATSGPAYRYVTPELKNEDIYDEDNKKIEDFYIPESWYVQQLVEGGIIGSFFFFVLIGIIGWNLAWTSPAIAFPFFAVGIMNLFLHSFESTYISLVLFSFIGLSVGRLRRREFIEEKKMDFSK